jgi:hypothetical protein
VQSQRLKNIKKFPSHHELFMAKPNPLSPNQIKGWLNRKDSKILKNSLVIENCFWPNQTLSLQTKSKVGSITKTRKYLKIV